MYRKNDDILKNGYGIVYKAVMQDERLSLTEQRLSMPIYAHTQALRALFSLAELENTK